MNIGDQIEHLLEYVAWTILWNKYFAVMFLVLGLYLTIGLRFFQFRRFGILCATRSELSSVKKIR